MEPLLYADAILLGVVQGFTEFLPVSSSGHLAVGQALLGTSGPGLTLNIVLHGGTLAAVVLFYAKDLGRLSAGLLRAPSKGLSAEPGARTALYVVLAMVPTGVLALLLKSTVEARMGNVIFSGAGFLLTAAMLLWARRGRGFQASIARKEPDLTTKDALLIGTVQGIAVFPGISRSGSTISTALLLGISPEDAARFSFLLAIPAIVGALALELRHGLPPGAALGPLLAGASVSFVTGLIALKLLVGMLSRGRFAEFAYYLVPLGLLTIAYGALA